MTTFRMKTLHLSIMILSCFVLLSIMLSQNVTATVPLVQIMLSGTANDQNCENKCVISQIVNVQKGTAVEWINNDLVPHTLVSGVPGDVDNGTLFDTGPIWVGKFLIHDFDDVGVYHYFEKDHPQNTGVVNVTDWTYQKLLSQVMTDSNATSIPQSPLEQFKSGIAANDVKCEQGLQLVIKAEDNSPACVKPQTAQKLVELGWGWAMQTIDSLKPLLPNRIAGLENDTGIVTFGNRTYYFETPHYTPDAYVNPVQISFHGVVFTLFPSGFKGGLPTNFGGVATNGCSGSYFWADAKFVDGTHKLLNIFAITTMSQHCQVLPAPTYFSTNTDPLAGLTFYDGKLKLLASVEGELQQNNPVFSTPIPTNETIYHDFPQPPGYPIINSTQGIIVNNDAEASNLTGFSVKSPTDLPQGYNVKLIKASKEIPIVTIFVSKYPLTENTTSEDFLWNQQGILITYDQTNPRELEYFNLIFPANKIITINGTPAVISDISKQYHDGYAYDMWGDLLAIQNNDTNIAIRGFFNSDELIKIATSMLEK